MSRDTVALTSSLRTIVWCIATLVLSAVVSLCVPSDERAWGDDTTNAASGAEATQANGISAFAEDADCPADALGQIGESYWYECWDHATHCWGQIVERSSPVELDPLGCSPSGDCYCELEKVVRLSDDTQVQKRYLGMSETFIPRSNSGYCIQWCGYAKLKNGKDGTEYGFKIFTLMRYRPGEPIRVKYIGEEVKNDLCVNWCPAKWTEPDGTTAKYRHKINVTVGTKPNVPITFTVTTVNAVVEQP